MNEEEIILSGPSFACLFVNCREKKKRKNRKDLYAGAPVSSLLRVYKSLFVPRKKQKEKGKEKVKHESSSLGRLFFLLMLDAGGV